MHANVVVLKFCNLYPFFVNSDLSHVIVGNDNHMREILYCRNTKNLVKPLFDLSMYYGIHNYINFQFFNEKYRSLC